METRGRISSATANPDGQIFLGANADFAPLTSASATLTSAGAGLLTWNVAASTTANFYCVISQLLRTGVLATPNLNQRQFGTAANVPGPSSVANTSGPLSEPVTTGATTQGFPPYTGSQLATITGGIRGALGKGYQINWVDVIYEVDSVALTSATFGLTQTKMPSNGTSAAPVVSNIIALAANGLPTATNTAGQATRTRITVASPTMLTQDGNLVIANANFVTPAGSTLKFYGCVLGVSFNFN